MLRLPLLRFAAMLAAFMLLAGAPRAAAPSPEAPPSPATLTGQLLVASPEIGDPRFAKTVIFLVRHDKTGALGLIINRPVEERSISRLLQAIGQDPEGVTGRVRVFAGGPVEPQIGFVLHSAEYKRPETIEVDGRLAVTSSPQVLRDIGHGKGPKKSLVVFGYAGWSAGQLEAEMARHDWLLAPADPKLVFDVPREEVWDHAMARHTLDL